MCDIKQGDKVIVINDDYLGTNDEKPPIKKEQTHLVAVVHQCGCGESHISLFGVISKLNYVRCYKCGEELPNSQFGGQHWCHSSRFIVDRSDETSEEALTK